VDKPPASTKATASSSHRDMAGTKGPDSRGSADMLIKNVKCYKGSNKKGHMAKACMSNGTDRSTSRVILTESVPDTDEDQWSCIYANVRGCKSSA